MGLLSFSFAAGHVSAQSATAPPSSPSSDAPAPVAEAPRRSADLTRLGDDLTEILDRFRWEDAEWGVVVVSLDRGDTLFSVGADRLMVPASNMKLFTTAAALAELGPDFRYRTFVVADGPVRDGTVHGNLVLYGTGDPGVSDRFSESRTAIFEALADQLVEAGIRTVTGDLVGDASYLPGPPRPADWDPRDLNDHFAAPVSALSFNENVLSLWVEAARTAGARPTVHTLPDHADLDVFNAAETVQNRPRNRLSIDREVPTGPVRIEGQIQRGGRDIWRQLTVQDPPRFAISVFEAVLAEKGITIGGTRRVERSAPASAVGGVSVTAPTVADRPRTTILARHVSPPLRDYLAVINKKSHNLMAELTFRTLGRITTGDGSPDASARAVARTLTELGVDVRRAVQVDGSGLAATNRVSPMAFVDVLRHVKDSDLWPDFWESLPEAGKRGEMRRMYDTPAAGKLRAKTGTIEAVSALSGVVTSAQSESLAFSIIVNGTPSNWGAKLVENGIGARLAIFERTEGPRPFEPVGAAAGAGDGREP